MNNNPAKEVARKDVARLVKKYQQNEADYGRATYNETQVRTDFITPLLEAFGWDVHNDKEHPIGLREVIEEATVDVRDERLSKKPDYELRLARQRKVYIEAKKPSVRIDSDRPSAFQTRRYGYSASLPIAILTNFRQLSIYDCKSAPNQADEAQVARLKLVNYTDFEAHFDELWDYFSREAIYSGAFDQRFAVAAHHHGTEQFDRLFLRQVKTWRERLAIDIHANTPTLSPSELTYVVQMFLSRIVFLRICEDRELENYESLKELDTSNTFEALIEMLQRADTFYNSGLFHILDDARLGVRVSDGVVRSIIEELYFPQSPYTFAVVDPAVLGAIYEQFLGDVITVSAGTVQIINKPEVRESGGVVPTPRYIVDVIVERALTPMTDGKSPNELESFTVADICCGSGIFLLSVYRFLLDHYLTWYLGNERSTHNGRTIYEGTAGSWKLTFDEKRRILLTHLRGVDIDPNAVDVARFSLLLMLIEDETAADLRDYVTVYRTPVLPELDDVIRSGNSLVSREEWASAVGPMSAALTDKVNPFTWIDEFPNEIAQGGFDVIVGNPPYIRIQNMMQYSREEATFYRKAGSPYATARQDNFDKYALFIERALTLLNAAGRLGVIVPHKFMTTQAGRALRQLIATGQFLEEIIHFGVQQVFGAGALNYTCILVFDKSRQADVRFEQVASLGEWRYGQHGSVRQIAAGNFTAAPWQFADLETSALFDRIRGTFPEKLGDVAEIFVGVQTSADPIYIFRSVVETKSTVTLHWKGRDWPIERDILRPCLYDVVLNAYASPEPNAWMIFPYKLIPGRKSTEAQLIQPPEMAQRFPGCFAYLTARRAELEKRHVTGGKLSEHQFYQFGRSQSLVKFDTAKIILPALSIEPRYVLDESNIVVTGGGNGPYYMIRPRAVAGVTNCYLLAILNHPLSEAIIRTNTSPFKGGYYAHGKQYIENLPIPIPSQQERTIIDALVRSLISALDAVGAAGTPHERKRQERRATSLRTQIEDHITAVYRLTTADRDVINAVSGPS